MEVDVDVAGAEEGVGDETNRYQSLCITEYAGAALFIANSGGGNGEWYTGSVFLARKIHVLLHQYSSWDH